MGTNLTRSQLRRKFWSVDLVTYAGTFIPRRETETLMECATAHFGERAPSTVLDICTGGGTLLLAALHQWPEIQGLGTDIDDLSLETAKQNAIRLGFANRAQWENRSWVTGTTGQYDLILCNPPYVKNDVQISTHHQKYEPTFTLYGGPDGLDPYRFLVLNIEELLAPGGIACFEIDSDRKMEVSAIFSETSLSVEIRRGSCGDDNCITLVHP